MLNFTNHGAFDTSVALSVIDQTDNIWDQCTDRQQSGVPFKNTKNIHILFNKDMSDIPNRYDITPQFDNLVVALRSRLTQIHGAGKIVRLFIEQLPANETINPFIYTAHQSIIESKRHIIPLVNGSNIQYNIDTEICTLSNDDIWEINTNYNTSIQNNGDTPAASIIVDWRVM